MYKIYLVSKYKNDTSTSAIASKKNLSTISLNSTITYFAINNGGFKKTFLKTSKGINIHLMVLFRTVPSTEFK